jgi:hypothetical protein
MGKKEALNPRFRISELGIALLAASSAANEA